MRPRACATLATGVRVDLLVEGHVIGKPGAEPFPAPESIAVSDRDPTVIDLPVLVDFKLQAKRHQDTADVVALLKGLDDASYLALEAATRPALRLELARLRDDALEELRFEET
jgi:hypothetical protein